VLLLFGFATVDVVDDAISGIKLAIAIVGESNGFTVPIELTITLDLIGDFELLILSFDGLGQAVSVAARLGGTLCPCP